MNRLNKLEVFYHERLVGTIALYQNRLAAFEYDSNWHKNLLFQRQRKRAYGKSIC